MPSNAPLCLRYRHVDRAHAGLSALKEAAGILLGVAPKSTTPAASPKPSGGVSPLAVSGASPAEDGPADDAPIIAPSPEPSAAAPTPITVVDRKNLAQDEEEMLRKLEELARSSGVGQPQLRAVAATDGAGWAVDVVVGSDVLAKAQSPDRGVAADMALSSALKNFVYVYASHVVWIVTCGTRPVHATLHYFSM